MIVMTVLIVVVLIAVIAVVLTSSAEHLESGFNVAGVMLLAELEPFLQYRCLNRGFICYELEHRRRVCHVVLHTTFY